MIPWLLPFFGLVLTNRLRIVASQFAILVLRNVLFTTAAFDKIFRRVIFVDLDVLFRHKLAQETDGVLAVNGAVALTRLLDWTLVVWSQLRTHFTWIT